MSHVVGKERVKFYSRPVVPGNQCLVPVIKYAPDVSRAGDDFTAEFLARRDSLDTVRRSVCQVASVSVQTLYRETETQTEPYTPHPPSAASPDRDRDLLALSSLSHGHGLPLQTEFDAERVRRLVRLQQEELELDSWQDSLPLSDDGFTTDNKLVKSKVQIQIFLTQNIYNWLQGMFDLSRFMVGTGSDEESEILPAAQEKKLEEDSLFLLQH